VQWNSASGGLDVKQKAKASAMQVVKVALGFFDDGDGKKGGLVLV
jgi:hypothetical protein